MTNTPVKPRPISGVGIGLRHKHVPQVLSQQPRVGWFELLLDNWLAPGGLDYQYLQAIAEQYPVSLHGVGLNLGGTDPLDRDYLSQIKRLLSVCNTTQYSDHACFTQASGAHFHDLCPVPFTDESLQNMVRRIRQAQDYLESHILIENVSSYITYKNSPRSELEFLSIVAEEADCHLLLDINNLYVNEINHQQNLRQQLDLLPANRIKEIHLAGHERQNGFLLDTHSTLICEPVWQLYQNTITRLGPIPTLIEWDHDIPNWEVLISERNRADALLEHVICEAESCLI